MTRNRAYLERAVETVLGSDKTAPERVLVWPDGEVKLRDGAFGSKTLTINKAAADSIISQFQDGGVDLLIDYEHQSEGGQFSSPDGKSPAAGWISALDYVPGEGLFAKVTWTDEARELIESKKYRYHSPVFVTDKKGNIRRLFSMALTNTPRTMDLPALIAASEIGGSGFMDSLKEIASALEIPNESTEGKSADEITQAILKNIAARNGDEDSEAAKELASTRTALLKALDIDEKDAKDSETVALVDKIVASAAEKYDPSKHVPLAQFKTVKDKLESLEKKVEAKEQDDECDKFIAKMTSEGKVVPDNEPSIRRMFKANPKETAKEAENWPEIVPKGSVKITSSGKGGDVDGGDRKTVIAKAIKDYAEDPDEAGILDQQQYVNQILRENDLALLNDEEVKKLA